MKTTIKNALNFVYRNAVVIGICLVAIFIMTPRVQDFELIRMVIILETLAITLSGLALWSYTKIPFFKLLFEGEDEKLNSVERHSLMQVLGSIFLAVHIVVGACAVGIYIAYFSN